jgi:ribose-phosphate pyrophosphokinase
MHLLITSVTSLADQLKMDFAMIHRERYEINRKVIPKDLAPGEVKTKLTLVGNVKDKVCFMLVGFHIYFV